MKTEDFKTLIDNINAGKVTGKLQLDFKKLDAQQVNDIATALLKNSTIYHLSITGFDNTGGNPDLALLFNNKNLKELSLHSFDIGDKEAEIIAKILENNTTLEILNLPSNNIGEPGAKSLAKSLEKNTTLKTLSLALNPLKSAGVLDLAESLKKNNTLQILKLNTIELKAKEKEEVTEAFISALKKNTALKELDLEFTIIKPESLKKIEVGLKDLTARTYTPPSTSHPNATTLQKLESEFKGSESTTNKNVTAAAAIQETRLRSSTQPSISTTTLKKNTPLSTKKQGTSSNTITSPQSQDPKTNKLIQPIKNPTPKDSKAELVQPPSLTFYKDSLSTSKGKEGLLTEEKMKSLLLKIASVQTPKNNLLDLSFKTFTEEEFGCIATVFAENKTFTGLDLSVIKFTPKNIESLVNILEKNTTLEELILENSNIDKAGAISLAKALEKNKTLKKLKLTGNAIGTDGAMAFASLLEKNQTLEELEMRNLEIEERGKKAFAKALEGNRTLKVFNYGSEAQIQIQEFLGRNKEKKEIKSSVALRRV